MNIEFHPEEFVKYITDNSVAAGLDTLKTVLNNAANTESPFLTQQAVLTAKYLDMRNKGKITGKQFQSLIADLNAAVEAELLKLNMTSRAAAQALCASLLEILKGSLSILIALV